MIRSGIGFVLLATVIATCSARAVASDLPFEDGFDTTTFGWVPGIGNVTVEWSPLDASGSPTSGSARVVNQRLDVGSFPVSWMLDCFAIDDETPYVLAGSILIPTGQATSGIAQLAVSWYASPLCTPAGFLDLGRSPDVRGPDDAWARVEAPSLRPPTGAAGARVGLLLFKSQTTGALAAHFDDVLFAPEPAELMVGFASLASLFAVRARARWRRRRRHPLGHAGAATARTASCSRP